MTECLMAIQVLKDLNDRMHNDYTNSQGSKWQNA